MTSSILWRLMWKEFRTQLSLWLSIAIVSIAVQLLVTFWIFRDQSPDVQPLYVVAFLMPCFFVLGYSGTTFAVEHELQTYDFLRGLPTKPRIIFGAKLLVALASTVCLFLVLWLSAYGMARGQLEFIASETRISVSESLPEVALTAIELFAWGCVSLYY